MSYNNNSKHSNDRKEQLVEDDEGQDHGLEHDDQQQSGQGQQQPARKRAKLTDASQLNSTFSFPIAARLQCMEEHLLYITPYSSLPAPSTMLSSAYQRFHQVWFYLPPLSSPSSSASSAVVLANKLTYIAQLIHLAGGQVTPFLCAEEQWQHLKTIFMRLLRRRSGLFSCCCCCCLTMEEEAAAAAAFTLASGCRSSTIVVVVVSCW